MTQKLYIVTRTQGGLVLAESAEAAEELVDEIARWEDFPSISVVPFDGTLPVGWDEKCIVYANAPRDYTVEQAIAIHEGKT